MIYLGFLPENFKLMLILLVKELTWHYLGFNYMTRIRNTKAEETSDCSYRWCSLVPNESVIIFAVNLHQISTRNSYWQKGKKKYWNEDVCNFLFKMAQLEPPLQSVSLVCPVNVRALLMFCPLGRQWDASVRRFAVRTTYST